MVCTVLAGPMPLILTTLATQTSGEILSDNRHLTVLKTKRSTIEEEQNDG